MRRDRFSLLRSAGGGRSQRRHRPRRPPRTPGECRIIASPSAASSACFLSHLLTRPYNLQGPPATMVQPLPIREGRRKRKRNSSHGEGAAASREEEPDIEELLQSDQPLEDAEGMEEVFATLASMKTEVEVMRRPLGTFESPARTCKELQMVQPNYKNG